MPETPSKVTRRSPPGCAGCLAICGFAEQLEFFETLTDAALRFNGRRKQITATMCQPRWPRPILHENSCTDGIPMWDSGAPHCLTG